MLIAAPPCPPTSTPTPEPRKVRQPRPRSRRCASCARDIDFSERFADNLHDLSGLLGQIAIRFQQAEGWLLCVLETRELAAARSKCLLCWHKLSGGGTGYEQPMITRLYTEAKRAPARSLVEELQESAVLARELATSWQAATKKDDGITARLFAAAQSLEASAARRISDQAAIIQRDQQAAKGGGPA